MLRTIVAFVHGFRSGPQCWDPFVARLEQDPDFPPEAYRFIRYHYPTALLELSPTRRLPSIKECASSLGDFLDAQTDYDQLFLVGHSMGGLVNPVGHPGIYEIDLFSVALEIAPSDPATPVTISGDVLPLTVHADNVAVRTARFVFSKQNRCSAPYEQVYRSKDGFVEVLDVTAPNQASALAQSTYYEAGKIFTYEFTPDRGDAFEMVLRIYNGFGQGQRSWHNHMKPNARYKLFRFALDLDAYRRAGYTMTQQPELYFHDEDIMDHNLCQHRVRKKPLPRLPISTPWSSTWEIADLRRGVVDVVWDVAL